MICMKGDVIFWHLPFARVSHISELDAGPGRWINPKLFYALINTRDGDSFLVPVRLNKEQYLEITAEVERVKTNS